jgi:hypothetical protein
MEIDLNVNLDDLDRMIAQMRLVNKSITQLKEENIALKKEIVRLQWILEDKD